MLSRRSFLQATAAWLASHFTSIAGGFLDWLTRICRFDGDVRSAAAG